MRTAKSTPTDSNSSSGYYASFAQSNALLILNSPIVDTEVFKMGLFGGFGVASTTLTVKSASEDGKYNESASPLGIAGASIAIGKKYVFLKLEAGYEYNNIQDLVRTGSTSNNIGKLELSGGYFNVGILLADLKLGQF